MKRIVNNVGASTRLLVAALATVSLCPNPLLAQTPIAAPAAPQDYDIHADAAPVNSMWADTVDLTHMLQDYGNGHAGKSVDENPLKINGVAYAHGIGTHANSELVIDLKQSATRFIADVGVDDEKRESAASVTFEVWVDNKKAASTEVMKGGQAAQHISVDLTGAKTLKLVVGDGGDGIDSDHGDWGGALILLAPGAKARPVTLTVATDPTAEIFMGPDAPEPAIHGPRIVGGTPGRPFLFRIPATGDGTLTFAAANLPTGLTIDTKTGVISGSLGRPGQAVVDLTVTNAKGMAHRELVIAGGKHKLAMTPPMGWNSWNVWAGSVTADKVKAAADSFEKDGLAAHGFAYVNIDDCWEGPRGADGIITTNDKFGDMTSLASYVHAKGLKLGIYSSPGPKTCAGFPASYQFETQDAKTYGNWGVDYLKYDWCSYSGVAKGDNSIPALEKPYTIMRDALDQSSRDIVYSLCQYGMGDSWDWAGSAPIDGNCWRTTGDINDSWGSMAGIGFRQNGHEKFAGPGHWNDPDMLVVGVLGWGRTHPSKLTGNEQITHISLWSLLSSPLLIGCDLTKIDPFTKALLTNDEILDINQDPLGKPAGRKSVDGSAEVWARPLFDGTIAVGLFNRGASAQNVTANWSDLGLSGSQPVRDLWRHKDLSSAKGSFTVHVPAHGAVVVKIGKPQRTEFEL